MGSRLVEFKHGSISSTSSRELYIKEDIPSVSSDNETPN